MRISYIDVFRGLLMLLVVLGHAIGSSDDYVNKIILSFHMPAFFFLSGMCFHSKSSNILEALKKKSKSLVWPYFTFSILGVVLYWLLLAGTSKDLGVTVLQTVVGIIWNDGFYGSIVAPGFWFVYDLIWITLIQILTIRVNRSLKFCVVLLLSVYLYMYSSQFYFSSELLRILIGYSFFIVGELFVHVSNFLKVSKMMGGVNRAFYM